MKEFSGIIISDGIAIGKATKFFHKDFSKSKNTDANTVSENHLKIINNAILKLGDQLKKLHEKFILNNQEDLAELINIQILLLEDVEFSGAMIRCVEDGKTAKEAIKTISDKLIEDFKLINDNYFSERAKDIHDLSSQLLTIIDSSDKIIEISDDSVIVCDDISVNVFLELPHDKISAVVLLKGSLNSHLSILLRILKIPAIISKDKSIIEIENGENIIVDCDNKKIIIDINNDDYFKLKEEIFKDKLLKKQLFEKYKNKETITRNRKKIHLFANIACVEDAVIAVENDAEGVGLLRTEFLCSNREVAPSEEEQEEIYFKIAKILNGRSLIIRTFDFGSDKKVNFLDLPKEDNPALGLRAIRLCLRYKEMFISQLRAIYKAAIRINELFPNSISIMFPMIVSSWEIDNCIKICKDIEKDLNLQFKVKLGIMIETPAAVVIADKLAQYVDFFSVGTNDLIQYTYAIDRLSSELNEYFQQLDYSPIYEMLKMISLAAKRNNVDLGICGEMASDINFTEFLLEQGFTEFSVNPNKILELRKNICEL